MNSVFDPARAAAIGGAFGGVPDSVYESMDRKSPAWPVLTRISEFPYPYGVVTGLALALSNYQLGRGGGARYWQDAHDGLGRRGPIHDAAQLQDFMRDLMRRPSASRLAGPKLARVDRLLNSPLPSWIADRSMDQLGRDCMELWDELARAMRQARDKKTIAYAMRAFDRMHMIATGRYVDFPVPVPIAVDLRIGRVSLASGLMAVRHSSDVPRLMETADQYVKRNTASILAAWDAVSANAGRVSLFRIDGLVWEVAEAIHRERHRRRLARIAVAAILLGHGTEETVAGEVAGELTRSLPDR